MITFVAICLNCFSNFIIQFEFTFISFQIDIIFHILLGKLSKMKNFSYKNCKPFEDWVQYHNSRNTLKFAHIHIFFILIEKKKSTTVVSFNSRNILQGKNDLWLKHISCKSQYKLYVRIIDILLHFSKVLTYFFCPNLCKKYSWIMSLSNLILFWICFIFL